MSNYHPLHYPYSLVCLSKVVVYSLPIQMLLSLKLNLDIWQDLLKGRDNLLISKEVKHDVKTDNFREMVAIGQKERYKYGNATLTLDLS